MSLENGVDGEQVLEEQPAINPPFEGPEKLLEIWFDPPETGADSSGGLGLRSVSREKWEEMLDIVRCKVLSVIRGEELDAYLLRCVNLITLEPLNKNLFLQRILFFYLSLQTYSQNLWHYSQPTRTPSHSGNCTGRMLSPLYTQVLLLSQKFHVSRTSDRPSP